MKIYDFGHEEVRENDIPNPFEYAKIAVQGKGANAQNLLPGEACEARNSYCVTVFATPSLNPPENICLGWKTRYSRPSSGLLQHKQRFLFLLRAICTSN